MIPPILLGLLILWLCPVTPEPVKAPARVGQFRFADMEDNGPGIWQGKDVP